MLWFPIIASLAAVVPLVLMAIGYVLMSRREFEKRPDPSKGTRE